MANGGSTHGFLFHGAAREAPIAKESRGLTVSAAVPRKERGDFAAHAPDERGAVPGAEQIDL